MRSQAYLAIAGVSFFAAVPGVFWHIGLTIEHISRAMSGSPDAYMLVALVAWWTGVPSFAYLGEKLATPGAATTGVAPALSLVAMLGGLMLERTVAFDAKPVVPLGTALLPLAAALVFGIAACKRTQCEPVGSSRV